MIEFAKGPTSTSFLSLCWELCAFRDEMWPEQDWYPGPGVCLAYKVLAPLSPIFPQLQAGVSVHCSLSIFETESIQVESKASRTPCAAPHTWNL